LFPPDSRALTVKQREFFEIASTWPDIIRDDKSPIRRSKYHHGNWHYDDFFWRQVNGQAVDALDLHADSINAVERLFFLQKALEDPSTPANERAVYLAWVLHLVGDIHQPLHCSARVTDVEPKGDQGGNLFYLEPKKETTDTTNKEPRLNLHWYWDSILRYEYPRLAECDMDYVKTIAMKIIAHYPISNDPAQLKPGQFDEWVQEGFKIAKTQVYPPTLKRDEMPSKSYQQNAIKISEQRIALAGYRLANLLNKILDSK
jgi:hypothetical protein